MVKSALSEQEKNGEMTVGLIELKKEREKEQETKSKQLKQTNELANVYDRSYEMNSTAY